MRQKHVQFVTTLSITLNIAVIMHLANNFNPSTVPSMKDASLYRFARFAGVKPTSRPTQTAAAAENFDCSRSIVYFGLRQHWFIFCNYDEFSQYKHMIQFPRTVDCSLCECSAKVHYTKTPADIAGHDIVVFTDVNEWITPEMWDWLHGNRTKGQIWNMITEESPLYVPGVQPPEIYADNSFDWFDSYMEYADFVHPYGKFERYQANSRPPPIDLKQILTNKTRLVAWMGSHCETLQWDRLKFVETFKKIIRLDTFGKCGDVEVPWNNDQIILDYLGKYKFYLSLENSCCDQYITEKFWRALEMRLVPVVLGAPIGHYRRFAPPNSFIHVDQFDSLTELVVHLISLHSNDEQYLRYHEWRNEGRLISYGQEEQYVRPLNNETVCNMVGKLLKTDLNTQRKLEYFGPRWYGSCKKCGEKRWISEFMHPTDHKRNNSDIWA